MAADFTEILLQKKIISPEQIVEARTLQQQTGTKLQDAIVELGYATTQEVMSAIAEYHGLQFIDLTEVTIPQAVIELEFDHGCISRKRDSENGDGEASCAAACGGRPSYPNVEDEIGGFREILIFGNGLRLRQY